MRYADRTHAGRVLAGRLTTLAGRDDVTVLALPRGGVPVAAPIATELGLPLDVLVIRKLGLPWQPELAMGAVGPAGVRVLRDDVISRAKVRLDQIDDVTRKEAQECRRQEKLYRAARPALDLRGKTAVLVDDGLATGASMFAAIRVARAAGALRVIAAAPVGATQSIRRLAREADQVVVDQPVRDLRAVGHWYDDFTQVTDEDVLRLLAGSEQC